MKLRRCIQRVLTVVVAMFAASVCLLVFASPGVGLALRIHAFSSSFGKEEPGSGNDLFIEPAGVAVSEVGASKGDVYIVDRGNNRVEVFNAEGTYLSQFDGSGAPTGVFSSPQWVAVDNSAGLSAGDVYVTDPGHEVIDKFTGTGAYIGQITAAGTAKFEEALFGVAVDPAGALWVYYEHESRGWVANYTGALANAFVATCESQAISGFAAPGLGFAADSADDLFAGTFFEEIAEINSSCGVIHESLEEKPSSAVAVDAPAAKSYVDNLTSIAAFDAGGTLLERFGAEGSGHLSAGSGLAVNSGTVNKPVYVADSSTDAVRIFKEVIVPDVTTEAASNITSTGATLHGSVNPDETSVTECEFEYGTEEGVYTNTAPCVPAVSAGTPLTGNAPVPVTAEVSGLAATTRYHYRLAAVNSAGRNTGSDMTFATPAPPLISSETVTGLTSFEPKLEAVIDPEFAETSYEFEYSTKASGETLEPPITTVKGAPPAPLLPAVQEELTAGPVTLHGLLPGPTYFYRVIATNSSGTTEGPVEHFQARANPAASVGASSGVTRTSATVTATVTPQGLPTTYHFAYASQAAYETALGEGASTPYADGRATHETTSIGSEYEELPVEVTLTELAPGTTYHYAVIAKNDLGETAGSDATFTTASGTPPVASTGSAEQVGQTSATINATVDTKGLQTVESFEFGTTPFNGSTQPANAVSSSGTVDSIAASESSLLPGTTYFYRAVASSMDGISYGTEQSFTTSSFPATLSVSVTPPTIPYSTITQLNAKEARETPHPKILTRAQKLAAALQKCHRKPKHQRASCERTAHHSYGPPPKPRRKK